jgi:diguanylate cyclase (GGDEF)-like protein
MLRAFPCMAKERTIGQKLLLAIGLPSLLIALAGMFALWVRADRAVQRSTVEEAQATADLVAEAFSLAESKGPDAHRSVNVMMRSNWQTFQSLAQLRVVNAEGVVRWSREASEENKKLPDWVLPSGSATGSVQTKGNLIQLSRPLGGMDCAGCHPDHAMTVGTLLLSARKPRLQEELTGAFETAFSGLLLFSLVIAAATAFSLQAFLRRPLKTLTQAMRKAEQGDFLVRAEVTAKDEIGQLALAFNQMLARITSLKAQEIDTHRDLEQAHQELVLKKELEVTHEKVASRLNELQLLYDVARSLTSTLSLPELLSRIAQQVAERLKFPQFSIMMLGPEGKLEVKGAYPAGIGTEGQTFDVGEGACGKAAATQRSIYIPNLAEDTSLYVRRSDADAKTGSLFSVPMIHKGTVLGVLNFQRPEPAAFSLHEIELLTAVADQASVAVKNALLHEETVMLSITDPLTGVPNRRHLFSQLEMEVARASRFAQPLSVLMIDIDHFKVLNDHAGHRAGDEVLRKVADVLRMNVRKVDVLARYGGEEFMLVLPQVSKEEAVEVAEKLRVAVSSTEFQDGPSQPLGAITVSVGVAAFPGDALSLETLVDAADSALYASKRGGRNRTTAYASGMELHPDRERGPHAAKKARTGEFPVVVLPTEAKSE